jgi:transcription elongation GreA/GreB family factor
MSQNARDMNAKQLQEALRDLAVLQQVNPGLVFKEVKPGSVVKTENGNYFISISAGQLKIDDEIYFAISALSPLGQAMLNKKVGDDFIFREKAIIIKEVF